MINFFVGTTPYHVNINCAHAFYEYFYNDNFQVVERYSDTIILANTTGYILLMVVSLQHIGW